MHSNVLFIFSFVFVLFSLHVVFVFSLTNTSDGEKVFSDFHNR